MYIFTPIKVQQIPKNLIPKYHTILRRSFFIPPHALQHTNRSSMSHALHSNFMISGPRYIRYSPPMLPSMQIRHTSRRPNRPPIVTSFPQFTPRPLKPLYQNKVFWGGIGFIGLLTMVPDSRMDSPWRYRLRFLPTLSIP